MNTSSTVAPRRSSGFRAKAIAALALLAPLGLASCGGLGDQCFEDCRTSCRRWPTLFVDADCLRECRKQCVLTGRPAVPDRPAAAPPARAEPAPTTAPLGSVLPAPEGARPERQAGGGRARSWGSIFVAAPPSERYGSSRGHISEGEARGAAHEECFRNAGPGARCRHLVTYGDSCASVVAAYRGEDLAKWFAASDPNARRAEANALAQCRKDRPDDRCRAVGTVCASGRG